MNHEAFCTLRHQLRADRPELLDLSELNLYRSLAASFPAIAPSTHREAPYRCHLAERYLAHLGFDDAMKPRTLISHGVRRSLRALLGLLASRGARVAVPSDVYPVYLALAAEAGAQVVPWAARDGLPALDAVDAVLVCEPLKPWGTSLAPRDAEQIITWVRADPDRRLVVIDSAYATPPTAMARRLLDADVAVLLTSLSKGWLIPDHVGLCVVPTRWQVATRAVFAELPKDEHRLRIGYAALTTHAGRQRAVGADLAERGRRLDELTTTTPELRASPCVGYFATAARSFDDLLQRGVLAIPASVFGGPSTHSLLSSLAPVPAVAP